MLLNVHPLSHSCAFSDYLFSSLTHKCLQLFISHREDLITGYPLHSTYYIRPSVTQNCLNLVIFYTVVVTSGHSSDISNYILLLLIKEFLNAGHYSHGCFKFSQNETPSFRENWKAPFSHLSVTIQSTEWQVHFSDHSVTIQCHSVTVPSPFSNIHFPFFSYLCFSAWKITS